MFRINTDRYWSIEHQQICQVLEVQQLFGQTYCRVWLPQQNGIVVAKKLPDSVIEEDEQLLLYHDNALNRLGED
ncbi:MAG: hypothetical protein KGQ16_00015 [Cyanobacteria bacterium REEB444]|nr:hypothetical protein [Cyanobacteria bacterium REEB444]